MAKILIVTYSGYGNWFALKLESQDHDVDVYSMGRVSKDILSGLIKPPLRDKPSFSDYELVIFDLTGKPALADEAINLKIATVGDSTIATELEDNRLFGIELMEESGINVPFYEQFDDINAAKKFIRKTKKRYVFKPFGGQDQDTAATYVSKSADDLLFYLDRLNTLSKGSRFLLQEVVEGTEVSTEGWFNGSEFFLINSTLEEKKLMAEGKGPATGCSGNLVWCYDDIRFDDGQPLIFREGLLKIKDFLQEVKFHGPIDLNAIVSDTKIYGLEWTPRFGYDAAATLFHLLDTDIGEFIYDIAVGNEPDFNIKNRFSAGIRFSIPPYPTEIEGHHPEDVPIRGIEINEEDEILNYYLYDAGLDGNDLVTVGATGFIGVALGTGGTIEQAFAKSMMRIKKLEIPDLQYRCDIEACVRKRFKTLESQGWLR